MRQLSDRRVGIDSAAAMNPLNTGYPHHGARGELTGVDSRRDLPGKRRKTIRWSPRRQVLRHDVVSRDQTLVDQKAYRPVDRGGVRTVELA